MRGFFHELVIAKEQRDRDYDRDMVLAWHIAALTRGTKGLPKVDKLLTRKRTARQQSAKEQVAMWQIAAARFGGVFRPADPNVVVTDGQ